MLEMRVSVRRVYPVDNLAIDHSGKLDWYRVAAKQLVACLESVISSYK